MKKIYFRREGDTNITVPYPAEVGIILIPLEHKKAYSDLYIENVIEFVNNSGWCVINKLTDDILNDIRFNYIINYNIINEVNNLLDN